MSTEVYLIYPGRILHAERTKRDLSIKELSARSHVSPTYIAEIEAEKKAPTIKIYNLLLRAMGLQLALAPYRKDGAEQ